MAQRLRSCSSILSCCLPHSISQHRYPDKDISTGVAQAEVLSLEYLVTVCSNNQLSVVHSAKLPFVSPPVLTLDRQGFLVVYVGREACGGVVGKIS